MKSDIFSQDSEIIQKNPDKNELLIMLQKNRKQELETMIMCQEKEEQLISVGAKLLLSQIRMDSAKHAHILLILIDLLKEDLSENQGDSRLFRYVGRGTTEYALQRQLKDEKNLIETYRQVIARIDDHDIKMLLHYVIEDEKRHQKMLREVNDYLSNFDHP